MQSQQKVRFKKRSVDLDELKQRQESKRRRRRVFYISLFTALCIIFTAVCFIVFFKIKTVEVEGVSRYSAEEIISAFGVEQGKNLYAFDKDEKEAALMSELPYINSVTIERVLPSTVIIHVEEKEPCMYVELSGEQYLLTDDMHILEYTADPIKLYGLLKLDMEPETVSRCIVGEKLFFTDRRTGDVISEAYREIERAELVNRVTYIDANNRFGIYIGLDNSYEAYMGDINEFDTKLAFLKGITDKLSTLDGGRDKGRIDVSEINKGIFTPVN
ncbi:MAG: FtsQ-type POTRA domain-containing protein [Clostridia bacterium]|nr:FtsQ-type POTRA domain-containing protein [Clostridia bacterium]